MTDAAEDDVIEGIDIQKLTVGAMAGGGPGGAPPPADAVFVGNVVYAVALGLAVQLFHALSEPYRERLAHRAAAAHAQTKLKWQPVETFAPNAFQRTFECRRCMSHSHGTGSLTVA